MGLGDDLYARDLLERCLQVLEDRPEVVLAHSLTAAIDEDNNLIQALEYPLATDDPRPARRLESLLFGGDATPGAAADDFYGIIRSDVLRRASSTASTTPTRPSCRSWRCWGQFAIVPDWLYFRRHHSGRAFRPIPRCARGVPTSTPSAPIVCDTPQLASLWSTAGRVGAVSTAARHLGRATSVLRRDRSLDGHPRHPPPPWRPPRQVASPRRCSRTPSSTCGVRRRSAGRPVTAGHEQVPTRRVGFFGKLGAGNYGNDGSLEALLTHLRKHHPSVPVDCMAAGPAVVEERYSIPAVDLSWDGGALRTGFRVLDRGLTALRVGVGVCVDAWRIARWTRRHSVAIVPGMGTFESTMQVAVADALVAVRPGDVGAGVRRPAWLSSASAPAVPGPAHPCTTPAGPPNGEPPVLP